MSHRSAVLRGVETSPRHGGAGVKTGAGGCGWTHPRSPAVCGARGCLRSEGVPARGRGGRTGSSPCPAERGGSPDPAQCLCGCCRCSWPLQPRSLCREQLRLRGAQRGGAAAGSQFPLPPRGRERGGTRGAGPGGARRGGGRGAVGCLLPLSPLRRRHGAVRPLRAPPAGSAPFAAPPPLR